MRFFTTVRPAIIIVCATFILSACSKSPESTIESFYKALSKGEVTEAKTYLSSQIIKMMGEEKLTIGLTEVYEKMQKCGGVDDIEIELTGEGELRSGTTKISYNDDCPIKTEKVKLIEEDGTWKITASK